MSNHLPLRVKRGASGWEFEWDEDALVGQAKVNGAGGLCLARPTGFARVGLGRAAANDSLLHMMIDRDCVCRRESLMITRFCTSARCRWTSLWRSRR